MASNTRAAAAADRKASAESGKPNPNQKIIDALNMERQGYVRRDLPERVKQVDAQLKHYGAKPETGATAAEKKAAAEKAAADKAAAEKAEAEKKAAEEGGDGKSGDAADGNANETK
ncbi:hypothetical protein LGT39_12445 [Demequina sp. TTPB684]|uniref:hypothetical protein n=1 Tax=unclassified Demequina TaxID=2620311 RepID=UPI001CF325D3|nr:MULTISPECIES: hypothetical protein [unclassified Demequina]MCB2413654.1 hypothetical protein [Demequina sp. TTPB684]UPU87717.1 hypothetical protein LGT36_010700 [Demequina sp. TMPB413]